MEIGSPSAKQGDGFLVFGLPTGRMFQRNDGYVVSRRQQLFLGALTVPSDPLERRNETAKNPAHPIARQIE